MIHVILDTNIYCKTNNFTTTNFKKLKRLLQARKAKLYVPYIVKREFQTQQSIEAKQAIVDIINLRVNYPVFSDAYCIGFASK
ncbi:MAG: rRNA-processing protein FCF1 [Rubritalea sp.]|jgi:rRNA-processing protein FCF1